jgi:hypothetical protein
MVTGKEGDEELPFLTSYIPKLQGILTNKNALIC